MGSASVITVEEQLREAGIRLLSSPSSADVLLVFLDRAEELLYNIQQAPPISVKEGLFPMMKALKADTLLKHSDVDVRVSVASCIHEITRIIAPKEPYNDDLMKEIFKLTVSALENLSQPSTRCYKKATSIIYTIARVRSFLVMVDLECDALIVEMFEHFLKHARLNHSEDVLWAMEQIMTLVLDETEDISFELLRPLLASVQKDNQNVAPISWELGNKVISNCASKLRPFVGEAVQSMDAELEDFAPIIASLCQSSTVSNEKNYAKDSKEHVEELAVTLQELGSGSDPAPKSTSDDVPGQTPKDDATSTSDSKAPEKSGLEAAAGIPRKRGRRPNSLMNPDEGYDEYWTIREKTTPKLTRRRKSPNPGLYGTRSKIPGVEEKNLPSNIDVGLVEKLEANGDGDHNSWSVPSGLLNPRLGDNALEPPENSSRNKYKDSKWQAKQQTSSRKRRKDPKDNLESGVMLTQDASIVDKVIAIVAANKKIEEKAPLVSVKIHNVSCEDECRSEGTSNMSKLQAKRQSASRKRGKATPDNLDSELCTQNTSELDKEISDVAANKMSPLVNKVSSEGQRRSKGMHKMCNLPVKQQNTEMKLRKPAAGNLERDSQDASIMDKDVSGVAIEKIVEKTPLAKKVSSGDECRSEGTPKTNRSWKRKTNKEEVVGEKTPLANKVSSGDECHSEGIPKTSRSLKRKAIKEEIVETPLANKMSSGDECHSQGISKATRSSKRKANKEEEPGQHYSSEQIVGCRIRVWWPMDKRYYEGLVDSYDHKKKRYLVVYNDGDTERLNLLKKRWEFVEEDNSTSSLNKDTDIPKHEEGKHSHEPIWNLRRNTPRSVKNANPYQLVKRSGASSSALRLEEAADGSDSSQPIVVKVEDYISCEEEDDSEATISETETTISL